jgi:hypothetical protein
MLEPDFFCATFRVNDRSDRNESREVFRSDRSSHTPVVTWLYSFLAPEFTAIEAHGLRAGANAQSMQRLSLSLSIDFFCAAFRVNDRSELKPNEENPKTALNS